VNAPDAAPLVMVVEDDAAIAEGLALNLRLHGYRAAVAADGDAAILRIEAERPALVLLDISLRGEDTWRWLTAFKKQPETAHIPVLVATSDEDERKAYGLGADAFLRKPVSTDLLVHTLNSIAPSRILIVDDDPIIIESLRETLRGDGHHVTAAEGGQAGIDAFEAARASGEPFELVITDLGMPYVDGRRVAASIKAASSDTPVVLLTGWGQRLMAENQVPPYVDRVLNKPPRLRELRAALAELARAR